MGSIRGFNRLGNLHGIRGSCTSLRDGVLSI